MIPGTRSLLANKILAAAREAHLEADAVEMGQRAIDDALAFVERRLPDVDSMVRLSNDGVLTLQWRDATHGVALHFTGDGRGIYSIKEPGGQYATNGEEFDLADGVPQAVREAISAILRA
jgi:hypothetical protein